MSPRGTPGPGARAIPAAWPSASPTPPSADQGCRESSACCHVNLIAHRKMLLENLRSVLEKIVDEAVLVGSSSGPSSASHATLSKCTPSSGWAPFPSSSTKRSDSAFLIHPMGSKEPNKKIGKAHFGNCEVLSRCGTIILCEDAKL